mmetsp:Transcript_21880/g.70500  ORF Transcript_21880/g.70500 Transcript_21880/m.70500 type:complete len:215 (-) Transcript_21880:130-774(-)
MRLSLSTSSSLPMVGGSSSAGDGAGGSSTAAPPPPPTVGGGGDDGGSGGGGPPPPSPPPPPSLPSGPPPSPIRFLSDAIRSSSLKTELSTRKSDCSCSSRLFSSSIRSFSSSCSRDAAYMQYPLTPPISATPAKFVVFLELFVRLMEVAPEVVTGAATAGPGARRSTDADATAKAPPTRLSSPGLAGLVCGRRSRCSTRRKPPCGSGAAGPHAA